MADSFLTQTPSHYFFETLTQSEFLNTYSQIHELLDRYPNFERFFSKATAHALKGALQRQVELQTFSAEEKFTTLYKTKPAGIEINSA